MKVLNKLLITISLLCCVFIIIFIFVLNNFSSNSKNTMIAKTMEYKTTIINSILESKSRQKKDLIEIITSNNDLSKKLSNYDSEWIQSNASLSIYENSFYNLDFLMLSNLDGDYQDFYSKSFSTSQFYQSNFWDDFINDSTHSLTGIDLIDDKIYIFAATPIYEGNNQSITGYIVAGQIVDSDMFKDSVETLEHTRIFVYDRPIALGYEKLGLHYRLALPLVNIEDNSYGLEFFFLTENIENIERIDLKQISLYIVISTIVCLIILFIYFRSFLKVFHQLLDKIKALNNNDYSNTEVYDFTYESKLMSNEINTLTNSLIMKDDILEQDQVDIINIINMAIDEKDSFTHRHSLETSLYAEFIAKKMKVSQSDVKTLKKAALVHDIGKIGIPDRILKKPDDLTEEEIDLMKSHVIRGHQMLSKVDLLSDTLDIVLYHHENWDGSGYPSKIKGNNIPYLARILSVADSFQCMISNTAYSKALTLNEALEEIEKNSNIQFDKDIVDILVKYKDELNLLYINIKDDAELC